MLQHRVDRDGRLKIIDSSLAARASDQEGGCFKPAYEFLLACRFTGGRRYPGGIRDSGTTVALSSAVSQRRGGGHLRPRRQFFTAPGIWSSAIPVLRLLTTFALGQTGAGADFVMAFRQVSFSAFWLLTFRRRPPRTWSSRQRVIFR